MFQKTSKTLFYMKTMVCKIPPGGERNPFWPVATKQYPFPTFKLLQQTKRFLSNNNMQKCNAPLFMTMPSNGYV